MPEMRQPTGAFHPNVDLQTWGRTARMAFDLRVLAQPSVLSEKLGDGSLISAPPQNRVRPHRRFVVRWGCGGIRGRSEALQMHQELAIGHCRPIQRRGGGRLGR